MTAERAKRVLGRIAVPLRPFFLLVAALFCAVGWTFEVRAQVYNVTLQGFQLGTLNGSRTYVADTPAVAMTGSFTFNAASNTILSVNLTTPASGEANDSNSYSAATGDTFTNVRGLDQVYPDGNGYSFTFNSDTTSSGFGDGEAVHIVVSSLTGGTNPIVNPQQGNSPSYIGLAVGGESFGPNAALVASFVAWRLMLPAISISAGTTARFN
jgi:hypothetical protein